MKVHLPLVIMPFVAVNAIDEYIYTALIYAVKKVTDLSERSYPIVLKMLYS